MELTKRFLEKQDVMKRNHFLDRFRRHEFSILCVLYIA